MRSDTERVRGLLDRHVEHRHRGKAGPVDTPGRAPVTRGIHPDIRSGKQVVRTRGVDDECVHGDIGEP